MLEKQKNIKEKMKLAGIDLSDMQAEQFLEYYNLLIEWNSFMNLTSITDFEEVIIKHFVDSALLKNIIELELVDNLLDIGTGAGFPAIPLKIIYPNLKITMIDSLNKRIKFLDEVVNRLKLTNIVALHGRAEDYAREKEHREVYEVVVSRAVANLSTLSEYCLPYTKIGGSFIAYKSEKISEEINLAKKAIELLGGKIEKQVDYELLDTGMYRNLCDIRKVKATSNKYPRKAGLPSKEPL